MNDPYLGRLIAGKYKIEAQLGIGAVGTVYRAMHVQLGREVAVKILRASLAGDPVVVARFTREAQLASRVEHPNVVRVYDCGTEPDGLTYLAMELLEGVELAEIIANAAVLPAERVVALLSQVLAALAAAHKLGIVHRDLKPENILVHEITGDDGRRTEQVKVADFGIARVYGDKASPGGQITTFGQISGTPEYMSPEQALAEELDGRSDLYAVGAVLYEILAGRAPFVGETPIEILEQHIRDAPAPPWTYRACDARLADVAMTALAKSRTSRYADANAMRAALVHVLELPPALHPHTPATNAAATVGDRDLGAPSIVIESGPSVIISNAAPSIETQSSVMISTSDDDASVVIRSNEPSVMISTSDDNASVLIASGEPSVMVSTSDDNNASVLISSGEASVLLPPIEASSSAIAREPSPPAVPATPKPPVAATPRGKSSIASLTLLAIVLLAGAAAAYWFLTGRAAAPPSVPPTQAIRDAAAVVDAARDDAATPSRPHPIRRRRSQPTR